MCPSLSSSFLRMHTSLFIDPSFLPPPKLVENLPTGCGAAKCTNDDEKDSTTDLTSFISQFIEQIALATTHLPSASAPPSSTNATFSNPENSNIAHARPHPTRLVLSIPDLELIRPSAFHTVVHQNGLRVEQVWIFQMDQRSTPHQPTPIENLIIYNNRITMIQSRILVLSLLRIPIRFLVAV